MRKPGARLRIGALCLLGAFATTELPAHAQSYPSRPIKMIVPFPAGGPLDIVARGVGDKLTASLKQNVIVENRPGAAGNLGSDLVVKSAPDGYTLLMVLNTTLTVNPALYKTMPFDSQRDLKPISILTSNSQMLVVHPSVPVNSVKEFVAFASKETVSYAHAGHGSPGHLVMEYFRLKAGFKANPVPYKGNAPLVNDLIAGHIKVGFVATAGVLPHVSAGRLRGLAISSVSRSQLAPNIPTVAESGYPDFNVETYFVLAAPAGLPDPIAAVLEREVQNALKAPQLQARLRKIDLLPVGMTGAQAKARIKADLELWAGVVKAANMRIE
ncbi:MAG: tripartite tricarboxylate transporter substrate binding protein [Rhizobiales bacterium]|nr:tripartite tricarboxylate transporter substrate binding protein [Hyphomicrobiales bacterium]